MKYAFMFAHRFEFAIALMARVLCVSRSGFYDWLKPRKDGPRAARRREPDGQVKAVFDAHEGRYGAPRITKELHDQGRGCDEKTVAGSLRRQGLRARAAKRFKATTNSNHNLPVAPNLLEQDFTATAANEQWVQDITYRTPGIRREQDARTGSRVCRKCRWARPGRSSRSNSSSATKMSLSGSDQERASWVM